MIDRLHSIVPAMPDVMRQRIRSGLQRNGLSVRERCACRSGNAGKRAEIMIERSVLFDDEHNMLNLLKAVRNTRGRIHRKTKHKNEKQDQKIANVSGRKPQVHRYNE